MKKILLILAIILSLSSCEKQDLKPQIEVVNKTAYSIYEGNKLYYVLSVGFYNNTNKKLTKKGYIHFKVNGVPQRTDFIVELEPKDLYIYYKSLSNYPPNLFMQVDYVEFK